MRARRIVVALLVTFGASGVVGGVAATPSQTTLVVEDSSPCVHRGITWYCGSLNVVDASVTTDLVFAFGNPDDRPLFGDWNGDGFRTPAVFRPSTITWYLTNTNDASDPPLQLTYGEPGDIPLAGDWDGDGTQTIGVYRPSNATFYLRNSNTTGIGDVVIPFGDPGDVPLAGDFGPVSGQPNGTFLSQCGPNFVVSMCAFSGIDTIGVFRPSNATFYLTQTQGPVTVIPFGNIGDRPLAIHLNCGSAGGGAILQSIAVFRSSTISWYPWCQGGAFHPRGLGYIQYGDPTDEPLIK